MQENKIEIIIAYVYTVFYALYRSFLRWSLKVENNVVSIVIKDAKYIPKHAQTRLKSFVFYRNAY